MQSQQLCLITWNLHILEIILNVIFLFMTIEHEKTVYDDNIRVFT